MFVVTGAEGPANIETKPSDLGLYIRKETFERIGKFQDQYHINVDPKVPPCYICRNGKETNNHQGKKG